MPETAVPAPPADAPESDDRPKVRYMDTLSAYELWSHVYDTDGNFLQALDTIEMKTLLPDLLSHIESSKPWRIVDLGCGTGRNTMALLSVPDVEVTALDLSPSMLETARERLGLESQRLSRTSTLNLAVFDMITASSIPKIARDVDAIISTLVVEHVPLDVYFSTASRMLKPGGLFLMTNMHSAMGKISQAGFIDPDTGEKIRPTSYAHTIEDAIHEAEKCGFEVVRPFEERAVDSELVPKLGPRADKWVGVTCWFGGILKKVR